MGSILKTRLRDSLPLKYQVPMKYWYRWFRGSLEKEMALLPFVVENQSRVLDIGGNRGVYAYCLWRLGARVEVFEPNPECCRVLRAWGTNLPRVNIHCVGLSNRSGKAYLHIPVDESGEEHDASASIEHTEFEDSRDEVVTLETLDAYGFEGVDLIKIDVEGHESRVIEGAVATISRWMPVLLVEIEQRHNSMPIDGVFQMIRDLGYEGFFVGGDRLVALKEFDLHRHQAVDSFGSGERYVNNFFFFHRVNAIHGRYDALFRAKIR